MAWVLTQTVRLLTVASTTGRPIVAALRTNSLRLARTASEVSTLGSSAAGFFVSVSAMARQVLARSANGRTIRYGEAIKILGKSTSFGTPPLRANRGAHDRRSKRAARASDATNRHSRRAVRALQIAAQFSGITALDRSHLDFLKTRQDTPDADFRLPHSGEARSRKTAALSSAVWWCCSTVPVSVSMRTV